MPRQIVKRCCKAFNSVCYHALNDTLLRLELARVFVEYMGTAYRLSKTVLEVSRQRSQLITVTRGVRQRDLVSTLLISMVLDRFLKSLPSEVGHTIRETQINGIAYLGDIVLYTSTANDMQRLMNVAERLILFRQGKGRMAPKKCYMIQQINIII